MKIRGDALLKIRCGGSQGPARASAASGAGRRKILACILCGMLAALAGPLPRVLPQALPIDSDTFSGGRTAYLNAAGKWEKARITVDSSGIRVQRRSQQSPVAVIDRSALRREASSQQPCEVGSGSVTARGAGGRRLASGLIGVGIAAGAWIALERFLVPTLAREAERRGASSEDIGTVRPTVEKYVRIGGLAGVGLSVVLAVKSAVAGKEIIRPHFEIRAGLQRVSVRVRKSDTFRFEEAARNACSGIADALSDP